LHARATAIRHGEPAVDVDDFLVRVEAAVDVFGYVDGPPAEQFLFVVTGPLQGLVEL